MKTIFIAWVLASTALLGASTARACPDCGWGNQSWDGERNWREGMPSMRRHHYLRHLGRMSMMANDAYLYWTIADGGNPIDTDMPAFNESLSEDEIWSVILYLRRGL